MTALLLALLICSATWATTVSARASTPVSDGGEYPLTPESDFINVTCTPLETEGVVRCLPSTHLLNDIDQYLDVRRDVVVCGVKLHLPSFSLKNKCQIVSYNPVLIRCTATIPRHLKHIAYCEMPGADRPVLEQIFTPSVCRDECAVHSDGVGCVIHEGCRLCVEDLRKYFPEQPSDACKKGI
ncbi:uncharacterized protein LOC143027652 [Oratosquilla oratoria]|uniref:uncharacterized protein LOC143027652 n=1 Tax=Oratosquilla oratoria TaxID=337810 RepID=UPI003F75E320